MGAGTVWYTYHFFGFCGRILLGAAKIFSGVGFINLEIKFSSVIK